MRENAKKYLWLVLLLILALTGAFLYTKGYRFQDNFTLGKMGSIEMTIPSAGTSIYLDSSQKLTASKDNEKVSLSVSPQTHMVIVSRPRYFPWAKKVTVGSGEHLSFSPIFVSQNSSGEIITVKDPQYWKLRNEIQHANPPTKDHPLISASKDITLWMEDNAILIRRSDGSVHTVVQPDTIIENVSFYKDRSDAVIFSTAQSIFVIETDIEHIQNILPIYKGTSPLFIETDPNYIYVLDGDNLLAIVI